jgi:exodeoxyribonuclease III
MFPNYIKNLLFPLQTMKKAGKRKISSNDPPSKAAKPYQTTLTFPKPQADSLGNFPRPEIHILSWNVNGIRAWVQKDNVMDFVNRPELDIICFNETKLQDVHVANLKAKFPNYPYQYWACSKTKLGYSGTSILSKVQPISWHEGLEGHIDEGRVTLAEFDTFFLLATYVPNSGRDRFDYRINKWDKDLRSYIKALESKGKGVVWIGDLNVINQDIDIHNLKGNEKYAGATPEERKSFQKTLSGGLTDTFRHLYPTAQKFSWFSALSKSARAKNQGWRIDMSIITRGLLPRLKDSIIYDQMLGSDHQPIELILYNS